MVSEPQIRLQLIGAFPDLAGRRFSITSEETPFYNCIAWAAQDNTKNWWPKTGYWPSRCRHQETIEAFQQAFATLGYDVCKNGQLEPGYLKVAFYGDNDGVLHAARQLPDGMWTSKLGPYVDISHELEGLQGSQYGSVLGFMQRTL